MRGRRNPAAVWGNWIECSSTRRLQRLITDVDYQSSYEPIWQGYWGVPNKYLKTLQPAPCIPKLNVNYSLSLSRYQHTDIWTLRYQQSFSLIGAFQLLGRHYIHGLSLSPSVNQGLSIKTLNIAQTCAEHNKRVNLIWIPSHVGIPGNEKADKLASAWLESPTNEIINNPLTAQEIMGRTDRHGKKHYILPWYRRQQIKQ